MINGFTLLELLISLVILAIIVAIGLPSFQNTINSNRTDTEVDNLFRDLNHARMEAINRSISVSVCSSSNSSSCAGTNDFSIGWIMFLDPDADGTVDAGDELIKIKQSSKGNVTIDSGQSFFCYNSLGMAC